MGRTTRDDKRYEERSSQDQLSEHNNRVGTFQSPVDSNRQDGFQTPSPIYVSMHDPLGEPAFRRSETKPIPRWMQYLPSQRPDEMDCTERPSSVLDDYFSPPGSSVADSDIESGTKMSTSPPPVPAHTIPVRSAVPIAPEERSTQPEDFTFSKRNVSPSRSSAILNSTSFPSTPAFKAVQMSRPFTFIDEKPGQRPSSRLQTDRLSPGRHVRFISPPKTPFRPTVTSASVEHAKSPSESSEYLDRHVSQPSQDRSSTLLPSSLQDRHMSVTTPFIKRYAGGAARSPAKTALRSLGDQSSIDLVHGSKSADGLRSGKTHTNHYEHASQGNPHGGGDGVVEFAGDRRPGRVMTFQDQLKRVFGFS